MIQSKHSTYTGRARNNYTFFVITRKYNCENETQNTIASFSLQRTSPWLWRMLHVNVEAYLRATYNLILTIYYTLWLFSSSSQPAATSTVLLSVLYIFTFLVIINCCHWKANHWRFPVVYTISIYYPFFNCRPCI